jgi:hypothetical protein
MSQQLAEVQELLAKKYPNLNISQNVSINQV